MSITVKRNVVTVEIEDLDIYAAAGLKDALYGLFEKGSKKVTVDLSAVNRITTPSVQVLISAKKTFKELKVVSVSEALSAEFKRIGVEL